MCAHRELDKYLAAIPRMLRMTRGRFNKMLAWISPKRKRKLRPLPGLTQLRFASGFQWQIQSLDLSEPFARLLQQGAFPSLECLDLSQTYMTDSQFEVLLGGLAATHLSKLVFPPRRWTGATCWSDNIVVTFSKLRHLQELGHSSMDCVLRTKAHFPEWGQNLRSLDFGSPYNALLILLSPAVQEEVVRDQALFPRLRLLRLEEPLLPPSACAAVESSKSYQLAQVLGKAFFDGTLGPLETLSIQGHGQSSAHIAAFANTLRQAPATAVGSLRTLHLQKFPDTLDLATAFGSGGDGRWANLQVLDLSYSVLGNAGLERLAKIIAMGCFSGALEELDLTCYTHLAELVTIGPTGLRALVQALNARGEDMRLKRLKLLGQKVGDAGMAELVAGWRDGTCFDALEELDLSGNQLTDASVEAMVAAGMVCVPTGHNDQKQPVLQRLGLGSNGIRGGVELRAQLQQPLASAGSPSWSSSLLWLGLGYNALESEGLPAIFACVGSVLQEVWVETYSAGSTLEQMYAMAHALLDAGSASLRVLQSLTTPTVPCAVVEEFMVRLKAGTTFPHLRQLRLRVTQVPPEYKDRNILLHALKEARAPLEWKTLNVLYIP